MTFLRVIHFFFQDDTHDSIVFINEDCLLPDRVFEISQYSIELPYYLPSYSS